MKPCEVLWRGCPSEGYQALALTEEGSPETQAASRLPHGYTNSFPSLPGTRALP